jgi:hypothetical protein
LNYRASLFETLTAAMERAMQVNRAIAPLLDVMTAIRGLFSGAGFSRGLDEHCSKLTRQFQKRSVRLSRRSEF